MNNIKFTRLNLGGDKHFLVPLEAPQNGSAPIPTKSGVRPSPPPGYALVTLWIELVTLYTEGYKIKCKKTFYV